MPNLLNVIALWLSMMLFGAVHALELEQVQPYYGQVAEDQVFILQFDQAVQAQTVLPYSFCTSSALGERIPLLELPAAEAEALLQEQSYRYSEETKTHYLVVQCAQRLAPKSTIRLQLFDQQGQSLVSKAFAGDTPGLGFEVRGPLQIQLLCDRTKSTALCNPLLPIRLVFSAPVAADIATQLQLQTAQGQRLQPLVPEPSQRFIEELVFQVPPTEQDPLTWVLPANWTDLKDDANRALGSSRLLAKPLQLAELPALLKFARESFGVLERFALAPANLNPEPALLPLAVRGIEPALWPDATGQPSGQLRQLHVSTPLEMLQWYARLHRVGDYPLQQAQLEAAWSLKEFSYEEQSPRIDPKSRSLFEFLQLQEQTQELALPAAPDIKVKTIELIGVPLTKPGLHILEAQSARLGQTYDDHNAPMYIRTAALVTNLAVHSKLSNNQLVVWVSRLDTAQPVANAAVTVLACDGLLLAQGLTDTQGRWQIKQPFDTNYCSNTGLNDVFVTAAIPAEHPDAYGQADISFVFSSWDQGIESWRFQLPYFYADEQNEVVHTVIDRPLFLAGETVHLKHYWLGQPKQNLNQLLPEMVVRHVGSGAEIKQALTWQRSESGSWFALSTLRLAKHMTLGRYELSLQGPQHQFSDTTFQLEAFKTPYLTGRLGLQRLKGQADDPLVSVDEVQLDVQLNYISGGVAADQAVTVTALSEPVAPEFVDYQDYRFSPELDLVRPAVVLDKAPLRLDAQGSAQMSFSVAPNAAPQTLRIEASFMDPVGQIQSLSQQQTLWPAEVVVGVKHPYWEESKTTQLKGVTLSPSGAPIAGQKVQVHGQQQSFFTTRQRMVGGFYRYDQEEKISDLGLLCEAVSNAQGEWFCDIEFEKTGQIILQTQAKDAKQRSYTTVSTLWLSGGSDGLTSNNHDRIEVMAAKKQALPGETVRFQVHLPFSEATALVAVEQGQVLHTKVVSLSRQQPFFDLQVQDDWGPNVYVSVLALRGRVYQPSWADFWQTGWKNPIEWYQRYQRQKDLRPTTQVDLAKPSFRYGVTELQVANTQQQLVVQLATDKNVYGVGQTARVEIAATLPSGAPAKQASVLLIGVDQALLELLPNTSWQLLKAMYPTKGYGVRTATMQSEVIGRRHYGRKAVPAGGGGGGAPTREILDSLLVWRTDIVLDDEGKAVAQVPLNHSVTQFELVALVDQGGTLFGTAQNQIQTHQAVQIMSGLPAEVRTGDSYQAIFTLRNRESNSRLVRLQAQGFIDGQLHFDLAEQTQQVAAQGSVAFSSLITMPEQLGANAGEIEWHLTALDEQTHEPLDSLVVVQQWQALVPVRTQELIWQRLMPNQPTQLLLSRPAQALAFESSYLGGVELGLHTSLGGQTTVKEWFAAYPYTCFEQQASKYLALQDQDQWQALLQEMPAYVDEQQLLRFFPSPYLSGNAGLTAYILSLSAYSPKEFALPDDLAQELLTGLHNYVEGRRQQLRPDAQEQVAFYLSALGALARYDMIRADSFERLALAPERWPTSALIDGLDVLQHPVFTSAESRSLRQHLESLLRQRLVNRGSALLFTDESLNTMPALMVSPVTNQARLLLTVADLPAWQDQIPALMHGLLSQQSKGRWALTTENSWALLALSRLDQAFTGSGQTRLQVGQTAPKTINWSAKTNHYTQSWSWEQNQNLHLEHQGQTPIWLQLKAQAAVPVTEPLSQGYVLQRQVVPLEQAQADRWQVGDLYRVDLTITAEKSSVWAVINDPIPAGAIILGLGFAREAQGAYRALDQKPDSLSPSYLERLYSGYRAYIEHLPAGVSTLSYVVRLNTAGQFVMGQMTLESLYDASVQAQLPLEVLTVNAAP